MTVNPYFQSGLGIGRTSEQLLMEDLIIEALKITGADITYIPRTLVNPDTIFGEDILSMYQNAYPIEMYLTNVEGWGGDKDMFSKFGITVSDKATFVVSKRRWEDTVRQNANNLQLPNRPAEGDLLYFPLTDSTFQITFVDHMAPFFQLSKFYVYHLEAELFQYSSERINSGFPEIDNDFQTLTSDLMEFGLASEAGSPLITESGGTMTEAAFSLNTSNPLADNESLQTEANDILDFSAQNPFGEL